MRYFTMILVLASITGCTWETYQNAEGQTALRQKYEKGTRVYYQDGSYSRNMNYNQYRPEQHAIKPANKEVQNVRGTTWEKPTEQ